MWLLPFYIFIFACVSVSADVGQLPIVFPKCCPKNHSLIKTSEINATDEVYECMDRNNLKVNYNITTAPLVIGDEVPVAFGIPEQCDKLQVITQVNEVDFSQAENHKCFDKIVLEINNATVIPSVPKIIAITCIVNETNNLSQDKIIIDHLRKCCPAGQTYDTNYHMCRGVSDQNDNEEMLVRVLNLNNKNIYEVENGLDCKSDEYGVELSEDLHTLAVEGSGLRVTTKSTGVTSLISQGEWCIDRKYTDEGLVARVCTRHCSSFDAYCMRKCCPVGKHYKTLHCGSPVSKCVSSEDEVPFDISMYLKPLEDEYNIPDTLGIRWDLRCPEGKVMLNRSVPIDAHQLTPDGFLKSSISERGEYCLEAFDSRHCPGGDITVTAVTCFVKPLVTKDYRISFVIISISSVCLALTLVVYCALPELRNLHGRTLICHVSMMLLAFSCLARVQYAHVPDSRVCTLLGYGIYFGFVAAFSWLNVMCLDIWWTFGSVRTVQPLRKAGAERRRFLWYSLYAWSFAITLTLTMFLLDVYPISNILDANIGNGICWFASIQNSSSDWPHYIFFVIPMGLVTCTNFVLWILTARHCARVKSEVHRLQAGSVGDRAKRRFRVDRAKYVLTGKLWVVMGAGWISELLSTLASEPKWLWMIIDLLNELQGVFIFLILVFKPKLYYLIRKRLGCSRIPIDTRLEKPDAQKNGPSSSARTSSTFLSRTISSDERANLRISQLNNVKQN